MRKGSHHTKEAKEKSRQSHLGKKLSEETKRKLKQIRKDTQIGPKNNFYGKHHTEEARKRISEGLKGEKATWFGKHLTKETKNKLSKALQGKITWNKGMKMDEGFCRKNSEAHKGQISWCKGRHIQTNTGRTHFKKGIIPWNYGLPPEKQPAWAGGTSKLPYGFDFSTELKDIIRERDSFECQGCGILEIELDEKLTIHHINYDKTDNNESNLIALCRKCNAKANYDRDYWKDYYTEILNYKLEVAICQ